MHQSRLSQPLRLVVVLVLCALNAAPAVAENSPSVVDELHLISLLKKIQDELHSRSMALQDSVLGTKHEGPPGSVRGIGSPGEKLDEALKSVRSTGSPDDKLDETLKSVLGTGSPDAKLDGALQDSVHGTGSPGDKLDEALKSVLGTGSPDGKLDGALHDTARATGLSEEKLHGVLESARATGNSASFDSNAPAAERSSNASNSSTSAAVNAAIVGRCWELLIELVGDLTQLSPANVPKDSSSNLVAAARNYLESVGETKGDNKKEPEGLPLIRDMLATIAELEYNLIAFDLVHMFPPGPTKTASLPTTNGGQSAAKVDQPSVAAADDSSRGQVDLLGLLKRYHFRSPTTD